MFLLKIDHYCLNKKEKCNWHVCASAIVLSLINVNESKCLAVLPPQMSPIMPLSVHPHATLTVKIIPFNLNIFSINLTINVFHIPWKTETTFFNFWMFNPTIRAAWIFYNTMVGKLDACINFWQHKYAEHHLLWRIYCIKGGKNSFWKYYIPIICRQEQMFQNLAWEKWRHGTQLNLT